MIRNNFLLSAAMAITLVCTPALNSRAEDAPGVPPEPKDAAEVFERYAKAVGGKEVINALKSRVTKGTVEIAAFNLSGKVETLAKAPNLFASSAVLDMGTFDRVFNGKDAWSNNPFNGLTEESGIELANIKEEAELHLPARMNEFFPGAKLKGKRKRDNADVYVVEVPRSGETSEAYFDLKTGLLAGWKKPIQTQNGPGTGEQTFQDYRPIDGVKLPFQITMVTPEVTVVTKITEVKHNVEVPAAKFLKPAK
jgi:hypothetical protein